MPGSWRAAPKNMMKGMVLPGTHLRGDWASTTSARWTGTTSRNSCTTLRNMRNLKWPAAAARRHAQGQGVSDPAEKPIRSSGTVRARSIQPAAPSSRRRPPALPIRRSSASGCATWPSATRASSASRPRCAKALAWSSTRRSGSPTRYFDVAIAEQHAVTFAAGLACEGAQAPWWLSTRPSCSAPTTSSSMTWRCRSCPSCSPLDRAGLVGGDGATHQGSYDMIPTCAASPTWW